MKNFKYLAIWVVVAFVFQSCATILAGSKSPVHVSGEPAKAKVYYNGSYVGESPTAVKVPRGKGQNKIQIKAENYRPTEVEISHRLSVGYLGLDILSGFWPLVIDFVTGEIYAPYPKNVKYNLDPISSKISKFKVGDKVTILADKYNNLTGTITEIHQNSVTVKFTRPATDVEKKTKKVQEITEQKEFPFSVIKKL